MRVVFILAAIFLVAPAFAAEPLTQAKVADYIETRIETNRLQMQMRDNAAAYDDVVQAFFKRRNALLRSRGWEVEDFEQTQERILAAESALERRDDARAERAQDEKEKAEIRANEFMSPEQKRQMIEAMDRFHEMRMAEINRTRPDWPAVEPYRDELDQLTDWVAGNVSRPPNLD